MAISLINTESNQSDPGTTVAVGGALTYTSGDLIVAFVHMNGDGVTASSTGFTAWKNQNAGGSGGHSFAILYKTAGASESGDYTFTITSSQRVSVNIIQLRGATDLETDAFDLGPPETTASASLEFRTIDVSDNSMGLGVGLYDANVWPGGDGFSNTSSTGYLDGGDTNPSGGSSGQAQCLIYKAWTTGQTTGEIKYNRLASSADHVPVHFSFKEGAGGGSIIPQTMNYYRQRRN